MALSPTAPRSAASTTATPSRSSTSPGRPARQSDRREAARLPTQLATRFPTSCSRPSARSRWRPSGASSRRRRLGSRRCRSSSSQTAERSHCASSGRRASSASAPSRSSRQTTPARCTRVPPTRRSRSRRISTRRSTSAPRSETGADAIHPGYGFLAENGDFAEAVEAAGLDWVGPPPEALRAGGDKLAAKAIAARGGRADLPEASEPPLIVKAAAGGGGRGMRVVRVAGELDEAARRGATGSPGGVRRRPRLPRALPRTAAPRRDPAARRHARHRARARRTRLLGAAAPSEGARGIAVARARRRAPRSDERRGGALRARDRLRRCGDRRVRARRPRVLLPRAERTDPGRASGHRGW